MRPLGERLAAHGFPVRAVRLAGHGTSVADLATTRWHDWLASVEAGLARLRAEVPCVAVAGLSMGGLLALRLARQRPEALTALVLCAPAVTLSDWRPRLLPWVQHMPGIRRRIAVLPKRGGRDILDPQMRQRSEAYDAIPLAALLSLLDLQRRVRRDLSRVTQPTLLLHGRLDRTVPARSQQRVRRGLGAAWIEAHVLARSAHVLTEDVDRDEVGRLVADFLERVERAGSSRGASP
jgi:carboxylesterase